MITTDAVTSAEWSFIEDPATPASAPVAIPAATSIIVGPYQIDRRINISATQGVIEGVSTSIVFYDPINSPTFTGQVMGVNPFYTVYVQGAGAIPVQAGIVRVGGVSARAMTIVAPTSAQEGMIIEVISSVNFAHTLTSTGNFFNGTATTGKNTLTWAAFTGASVRLVAIQSKWHVANASGVTLA